MSDAKINLIAAVIVLISVLIPLVLKLIKWATGKGVVRTLASLVIQLIAIVLFVCASYGRLAGGWSKDARGITLTLVAVLILAAFTVDSGQPTRREIALAILGAGLVFSLSVM